MKKRGWSVGQVGLVAGLGLFVALLWLPPWPPLVEFAGAKFAGASPAQALQAAASMQRALAVLLLLVVWWLTEALPIPAAALAPALLAPLLGLGKLAAPPSGPGWAWQPLKPELFLAQYADSVIFLFLGGFILAAAMTYQQLDRRITFAILSVGSFTRSPARLLLGVMGVTAFLSMWMNNTSTTAMLMPIGVGLALSLARLQQNPASEAETSPAPPLSPALTNFGACLALGIAYAASIGGIATMVGSTPNGIAVSMLRQQGLLTLDFVDWLAYGLPAALVILGVAWWLLPRWLPFGQLSFAQVPQRIAHERARLEPMGPGPRRVLAIFIGTALLWILVPFLKDLAPAPWQPLLKTLAEPWVVAMLAAGLVFVVPAQARQPLVPWAYVQQQTDWGALLLFGGGLAMSRMLAETYVIEFLAGQLNQVLHRPPLWLLVLCLTLFVNFLTEVSSNTAVASMMTPLAISLAQAAGLPVVPVAVGIAFGASMAFMLPIATPPNAIAYGTGLFTVKQMARIGLVLNLVSTGAIVVVILLNE
ncbi:MAG: DASS family sodium-coupled anion symporter [Bernardetiaceae bacterium]|jgi:sodium-dependent dicarboxylate transporter 2/3/5|nr:DASS family sodium-coupled anion symporter [Bernardetiaceae bacterium]